MNETTIKTNEAYISKKMWCKTNLSPNKSDNPMEQNKHSRFFSKIM